ncbi:hypothetical protein [Shinella sp.]
MIYVVSALAVLSALLASMRPTIWSLLAAAVLNGAAAWLALEIYLGR